MARNLSDVENGEVIKVNVSGFIVEAHVVNNCPEERKMHLIKVSSSGNRSECVERYDDYTFINFKVLNPEKKAGARNDLSVPTSNK